jgi:urease accessory protein
MKEGDIHRIIAIDEELSAIRPAGAVRRASMLAGRRLLSLYASIGSDDRFESIAKSLPYGNAAAAYALVFSHEDIGEREAVLAFGYNRLAGMVSAGLRFIAIGQQQGQTLLSKAIHRLPDAAAQIVNNSGEPLRAFSPLLDIQQMNHQYIYSRLFRS